METLLRNDFTAHHGLPVSTIPGISASTNARYFELKDDRTLIYPSVGDGVAKYDNRNSLNITVVNFETFFDSLPVSFIKGIEKCDLIVHDDSSRYFLLNELTNTSPEYVSPFTNTQGAQLGKRQKSISQLLSTLTQLLRVPSIAAFASNHIHRHCCFFSKHPTSPPGLTATSAFNRLSSITTRGHKM